MRLAVQAARKGLAAAAAVAAFATVPVLAASPASAAPPPDPSCITSANATVNSARTSVTVRVTSNPCSRQVRAWAECWNEAGGHWEKVSGAISGTGSTTAGCGAGGYVNKKGHEVNVPGQGWTRYVY